MQPRIKTAPPRVTAKDSRRVQPPKIDRSAKSTQPIYHTPEYRAWQKAVIAQAGGRCEHIEAGRRCPKARPQHRMFADHRVELRDGGAPFDPANGQCLCGQHHTLKTIRARVERFQRN